MENSEADCRTVLKRLYLYLDREIEADACAEIDRHLQDCRSCLHHVGFEREIKVLVQRKCRQQDVPEALVERVREMLRDYL